LNGARVPKDFPVRPLKPGQAAKDRVTCGTCGLSWDDAIGTTWTPTPSGRCPFEYFHKAEDEGKAAARRVKVKRAARALWALIRRGERVVGLTLDNYTVNGWDGTTLTVGCHQIPATELDRVAQILGLEARA
jgi:hypothetical protein